MNNKGRVKVTNNITKTIVESKIADLGIEYAHIYTNQYFNNEQLKSIVLLKEIERNYNDKNIKRVILVDDYSPDISFEEFNFFDFHERIISEGGTPDVVVCESELVNYCKKTVNLISNKKLRISLENFYESRGKYPCSLFIASWYLLRLGAFGKPQIRCIIGHQEQLLSHEIITIVPAFYEKFEISGLKIIDSTNFKYLNERIKQVFFDRDR